MQEERNPQQDEDVEGRTGRADAEDQEVEAHVKHRTGRAEGAGEEEEVEAHRFFQQPEDPSKKY